LLAVIKNCGGGDNLFVLRKMSNHFQSVYSMPCGFVQLTGKYVTGGGLDPVIVDTLPEWRELQHREIARRPFWWGGKGHEWFRWQTLGIRSFLGITEPLFRAFKTVKTNDESAEMHYFGLWDPATISLVLAKDDELISYGHTAATEQLLRMVHRWVDLGMPTASSFQLQVYVSDQLVVTSGNQWAVWREESQFLWSL
jgi:hypothetical protein